MPATTDHPANLLDITTVSGAIQEHEGRLRCRSERTFGALFFTFVALPTILVASLVASLSAVWTQSPMALVFSVICIGFAAVTWFLAGGRFGTFIVDEAGNLEIVGTGITFAANDVNYSSTFDLTDGINVFSGAHWVTARGPKLLQMYRLGKMSSDDADRVLAWIDSRTERPAEGTNSLG